MYELNRIRIISAGPSKARYDDVTLDLSCDPDDPASLASVIWLQNGGGKSVLLTLLFGSLLPNRRDTLGAESDAKTFNGLVLSRDTAHVLAEWRRVDGATGVPPLLITGRVMEWQNQRSSSDSSRLHSRFIGFHPNPDALELDTLPVVDVDADGTERKVRMSGYLERLGGISREHPGLNLVVVSRQHEWAEYLENVGLDPELFRYQVQMNKTEGKADEVFKFANDRAFVDFLLRAILDRDAAQELSDSVSQYADKLTKRDEYALEMSFVDGALDRLRPLATAQFHAQEARDALITAFTEAVDGSEGMQLAATDAETRAAELKERADEQSGKARTLNREYERLVETGNELELRVAQYEVEAATVALDEAGAARADARQTGRAWELVEPTARLGELTAQRDALARALAEATTEAEPLRLRRDETAACLVATLKTLAARARAQAEAARTEADTLGDQAKTADEASFEDTRKLSEIRRDIAETEKLVRDVDAERDGLAADGLISAEEPPETAMSRLESSRTRTEREIEDAEAEAERAEQRLASNAEETARLAGEIERLRPQLETATTEHAALTVRAQRLAANEILQEILDSQAIDLWESETALIQGLRERIARAERQVIDTRLETVEDERIVDGVDNDGLVPAHRDVTDTVQALQELGIAAHSGWHYLHANVAPDRRAAVLAACPQLAAGVVIAVAEHLPRAQEAIRAARRDVRTLVTVGDARRLIEAADSPGETETIVTPDPGLYDSDEAAEQADRARGRKERADARRQAQELVAQTARDTLAKLTEFLDACPAGHLDELSASMDEHGRRLQTATDTHEKAVAETARLRDLRRQLTDRVKALRIELTRIDRDLPRLTDWARRAADAQIRRSQLAELAASATALDEQIAARRREVADLRQRAESKRREATADEDRADRLSAQVAELHGVPTDVDENLAVEDLQAARSAYEVADRAFREQTTDSELAERLARAEAAVSDVVAVLAEHEEGVRARAQRLLDEHRGADRQLLRRARREADAVKETAEAHYARAETAHETAQRALAAAQPPSDRRAHIQLDEEWTPTGLQDARDKRARAGRQRDTKNNEANAMRAAAADSAAAAAEAAREAETLTSAARGLRQALQTTASAFELEEPPGAGIPHEGSAEAARDRAHELADALTAASTAARTTAAERDRRVNDVMRYARDARFAAIREHKMVIRLAEDAPEHISRRAAETVDQLRQRREQIGLLLSEIGRHRDLLVRNLHHQVNTALHALRTAGRSSRLPEGLHEWSGHDFLQIKFTLPDSEDTLFDRLGTVLDEAAAGSADRDAVGLVLKGVHAAARPAAGGDGGFRVTILKPDPILENQRVSISEMSVFSGGQRSTAAIALYCAMAKMRGVERGRRPSAKTGVLFLDNPLGSANAQYLLDIQLRVAAALGVQLVYTTGVNDLNALSMFGRVLPLRNDADLRQGLRFVHLAPEMLHTLRGEHGDDQGLLSSATIVMPSAAIRGDTPAGDPVEPVTAEAG